MTCMLTCRCCTRHGWAQATGPAAAVTSKRQEGRPGGRPLWRSEDSTKPLQGIQPSRSRGHHKGLACHAVHCVSLGSGLPARGAAPLPPAAGTCGVVRQECHAAQDACRAGPMPRGEEVVHCRRSCCNRSALAPHFRNFVEHHGDWACNGGRWRCRRRSGRGWRRCRRHLLQLSYHQRLRRHDTLVVPAAEARHVATLRRVLGPATAAAGSTLTAPAAIATPLPALVPAILAQMLTRNAGLSPDPKSRSWSRAARWLRRRCRLGTGGHGCRGQQLRQALRVVAVMGDTNGAILAPGAPNPASATALPPSEHDIAHCRRRQRRQSGPPCWWQGLPVFAPGDLVRCLGVEGAEADALPMHQEVVGLAEVAAVRVARPAAAPDAGLSVDLQAPPLPRGTAVAAAQAGLHVLDHVAAEPVVHEARHLGLGGLRGDPPARVQRRHRWERDRSRRRHEARDAVR
mmetsp:Transcript_47723/g.147723  ORF Transcript_47723/g.147723 Transcript_47723/m.147723 type:complete len:458 (+) Transcript_47723:541-1914(+)